jgi:hypothetical protein
MSGKNNEQGQGPPEHAEDRGPPEHVRERWQATKRTDDGTLVVGDDAFSEFTAQVDWDNLSPTEEYILAILDKQGLLPDQP